MQALLWTLLKWVFREAVVKFVILAAIYIVVGVFLPMAFNFVLPFVGVDNLTTAWAAMPSGVAWGLALFRVDFALPLIISAYIARFMIRRLPVVG